MILAASGDFFTTNSLGTFGGVTLATVAVGNASALLFKRDIKAVPFVAALVLCVLLAADSNALGSVKEWIVSLLNGCLVFCTAAGAQVTTLITTQGHDAAEQRAQAAPAGRRVPWLRSWVP